MGLFFEGSVLVVGQTGPVTYLGPIPLYLFGITTAVGVAFGLAVALLQAERFGLSLTRTFEAAALAAPMGVIGARIGYVLTHWADYRQDTGAVLRLPEGGFLFYGAVLGGVAALLLYGLFVKVDRWRLLDAFAPGLAAGQAVGLVGAQVLGQATTMPWGVVVQETVIHPLPAYGIVLAYGLFFVLWRLGGGKVRPGSLFLTYLLLHGIGSLVLGSWSAVRTHWGMIPTQWGGIAAVLLALAITYARRLEPMQAAAEGGGAGWATGKHAVAVSAAVGASAEEGAVTASGSRVASSSAETSSAAAAGNRPLPSYRRGGRRRDDYRYGGGGNAGAQGRRGARLISAVLWLSGLVVLLGAFIARVK